MAPLFKLSVFGKVGSTLQDLKNDKNPRTEEHTFSSLVDLFLTPYLGFSPQIFKPGGKTAENGLGMPSLLVFDIDDTHPLEVAQERFKDFKYIIYTSKSHQKDKITKTGVKREACDRYRVVLVLENPILDKDVWKATCDWVECETGIINDPQVHFWMFFYPGLELVAMNANGKLIKPVTPEAFHLDQQNSLTPAWNKYYTHGKGILTKQTRLFLKDSSPDGQFNKALFMAAADAKDQKYTLDEFKSFYLDDKEQKKFQSHTYFDDQDEVVMKCAFAKAVNPSVLRLPPARKKKQGRPLNKALDYKPESIRRAVEVMNSKFLMEHHPEATLTYEITNAELKEVRLIQNEDILDRFCEQERFKEENLMEEIESGTAKKPASLKQWREAYRLHGNSLQTPVFPFLLPHQDGFTLKKLTFEFESGFYPAWYEFLDRLSSRIAFMQWVGSVFDLENKGRQALWLYGPRGEDGKSRVLSTLLELFGEAGGTINGSQIDGDSRFFFANLYKKRLVTYPDCKKPRFVTTEIFRQITSGDDVNIEFKGQTGFTVKSEMKLAIASNKKPAPDKRGQADISRILMLEVKPSQIIEDPHWEKRLREEAGYFIFDCIHMYEMDMKSKGLEKVPVPQESIEMLEYSADQVEENYEIMSDLVEFNENINPAECIEANQLAKWYYEICYKWGLSSRDYGKFKEYLETQKGVRVVKTGLIGDRKRRYFPIVRLKEYVPTISY